MQLATRLASVRSLVALAAFAFAFVTLAGSATAATLTVTTSADNGIGSLRQAIAEAATGDTIVFVPALTGATITLATQLMITNNLTIDGRALASPIRISGSGNCRVLCVSGSNIAVALRHLIIIDGASFGGGGGVYTNGRLTLEYCSLSNNSASGISAYGGGIYNDRGTLVLAHCSFSGNTAYGGGLYSDGQLTATDCTFSGNNGGGVISTGFGTVVDCTISGNSASAGGGISASGTLTLTNCTISDNTSSSRGGGISNGGTLTVTDCVIRNNTATGSTLGFSNLGGGLYNGGTARFLNTTIEGNHAFRGSGIYNDYATLILETTTLAGNTATSMGGALYSDHGTVTATHTTIVENTATAGGGIYSRSANMYLTGLDLCRNTAGGGGAISAEYGVMEMTNSTLAGNTATQGSGGAISHAYGTLTLRNSTVSGNLASQFSDGGGISTSFGTLVAVNCTVTGNQATANGGGIHSRGTLTLLNSIVAANTTAYEGPNLHSIGSTSIVQRHNLSDDWRGASPTSTDIITTASALRLGDLATNGGPTKTCALLPGSPAIDAGDDTDASSTDQRGAARTGVCDIGAFESQGFTLHVSGGADQSAECNTPFAAPLAVDVIANSPGEPVDGGAIFFTQPEFGASATLPTNLAPITGGAASITAAANSTPGTYSIAVGTSGAASRFFTLTNLTGPELSCFGDWAKGGFSAAELGNPAVSGATADPDGSGITNLMRYALDLPARGPVSATTTSTFNGGTTPATLSLSFTIRAKADDLLYEVLSSQDLVTWNLAAPYSANGTKRTELATVPVPAGAKRFFLRLQVTQVP